MSPWRLTGAAAWNCWERWICFAFAQEKGHTGQGFSPFLSPTVQCTMSVCLSHSHLHQPLAISTVRSWAGHNSFPLHSSSSPFLPVPLSLQGSWGLLNIRCMNKPPPPRVQCTRCAGPSTQVRSVLLCAHGEFACTDLSYWPRHVSITDKLDMYHVTL